MKYVDLYKQPELNKQEFSVDATKLLKEALGEISKAKVARCGCYLCTGVKD